MATAAPEAGSARVWLSALLWAVAGGWAFAQLPPDGSAGAVLGAIWAVLLLLRWLPQAQRGRWLPRLAGLCCPAAQPRASDVAMGWMMGTLWWHAEGCLGGGAPAWRWVLLHALGMVAVVGLAQRLAPAWRRHLATQALGLATLLGLTLTDRADVLWLMMMLLTLAWASEPAGGWPARPLAARALMLLCGPLGLWAILWHWPMVGPQALTLPVALLGLASLAYRVMSLAWPTTRPFASGGSA